MVIHRKIRRPLDGDTLETVTKFRGTNYIRIAGLNAPEKGESGYAAAKNKLERLKGKVVTIVPKGRSYNRIVAEVRYRRRKIR